MFLVGAGPGDEGLITVRGLELLRSADVVIYDSLANPRLRQEAPPDAQHVPVGARGDATKLSQDEINELMLQGARQGKHVVRLKGGDPYLFGRGGEEAEFLGQHGIACEVVPGVTAGIAAPMAAGLPITRRDLASTVTFVTGHEDASKEQAAVDYEALAALIRRGGSVCFYMAMARLGAIARHLQATQLGPDTPVAIVQWGFTPRQRSIRTTLARAESDTADLNLGSPAIVVVGQVAAIDGPGLDFYTRRPLFGRRIVITRTRQQASRLRVMLAEIGADVLEAPTIELVPPSDWTSVDQWIARMDQFDWLLLTSVNGVLALADRLNYLGLDSRHLASVKIGVIGDATEATVYRHLGIRADLVPPHYVSESLAKTLITNHDVRKKRILMLRADLARTDLRRLLTEAGASVTDVTIYETKRPGKLPDDVINALRQGEAHWITFTSSSTAQNMASLLAGETGLLDRVRIASIGPITSRTIRGLGWPVAVEAVPSNLEGLVEAILKAESGAESKG